MALSITKTDQNKTFSAKPSDISKEWFLIDATDLNVGRLSTIIANRLMGKHKAGYTLHMDCGDNIIVINAEKIYLSGSKMERNKGKIYYHHTGYMGGIKQTTAGHILAGKFPERVLEKAVKGMIAKGPMGRQRLSNLYIYAGSEHPHHGQKPTLLDIASMNRKNKKQ